MQLSNRTSDSICNWQFQPYIADDTSPSVMSSLHKSISCGKLAKVKDTKRRQSCRCNAKRRPLPSCAASNSSHLHCLIMPRHSTTQFWAPKAQNCNPPYSTLHQIHRVFFLCGALLPIALDCKLHKREVHQAATVGEGT